MAASMEHTRLTFSEAKSLISKCSFSHLEAVSSKRHVVLPPKFFNSILQGVKEHLNSELQLVASWTDGVLMAYNNVKILETVGRIFDESPYIHFNVEADFIMFRPTVGCLLKGIVNKKSTYHVGCLVHQCFNASIHKPKDMQSEWEGTQLQLGDEFIFKVTNIYTNNGVLSLRGNIHEKTPKKKKKSKKKSLETADSSLKDNEDDLGKGDSFVSDSNNSNVDSGIGDISLIKPQKRKKKTNEEANNNLDINNGSETPKHKKKKKHKNEQDPYENGLDITDEDSSSQKKKKKKHKHDNNEHDNRSENGFLSKSMNDGSFKQKKFKQETLNQSESDLQHIPETSLITDYKTGKKKKIKQECIDESLSSEKISKKKRRHSNIDDSQDFTVSSTKKIKKERM
ncbi:DNA-directed RNA polymerase I subunit RPA43-like [Mytilus californianus]|uniref:DNA-directed RNA polymerase I subunit RPA43-like n=1 Tax=Mytilus californianus TaxID=6549 RepID=UPI0022451804|nr:DNA-directed RNA polymerase I subunit RPA43-like [Mytilus californianus]